MDRARVGLHARHNTPGGTGIRYPAPSHGQSAGGKAAPPRGAAGARAGRGRRPRGASGCRWAGGVIARRRRDRRRRAARRGGDRRRRAAAARAAAERQRGAAKIRLPAAADGDLDAAAKAAGCKLAQPADRGPHARARRSFTRVGLQDQPADLGQPQPESGTRTAIYEPGDTPQPRHARPHARARPHRRPVQAGHARSTVAQLEALLAEQSDGYHMLLFQNTTNMPYAGRRDGLGPLAGLPADERPRSSTRCGRSATQLHRQGPGGSFPRTSRAARASRPSRPRYSPWPVTAMRALSARIRRSSRSVACSMYQRSSSMRSAHGSDARPLTCAQPVSPGARPAGGAGGRVAVDLDLQRRPRADQRHLAAQTLSRFGSSSIDVRRSQRADAGDPRRRPRRRPGRRPCARRRWTIVRSL